MAEVVETRTSVAGRKNVTGQTIDTPFGRLNVEIRVGGYKSSEGDIVYEPPVDTDDLDGAEAQTGEA
jgi:hypothetical protein